MSLFAEQPPVYEQVNDQAPREAGDNIPDDFKYSVDVASCELPVRQMFVRKVYSLLSVQIFGTVLVGFLIRSSSSVQSWCFNNMWLFYVSMVFSIGFSIATMVKAKSYPTNLILLGCFTLSEAYGLGMVCALVESEILVQALLLTFVIFIGLTLFAFQTKYDFVSWQGFVGMALWGLIGWGFVMMFFPHQSSAMEMIYSGIGAAIFSVYIVIDTQRLMKTANLDDEVMATMSLYLDILNLFLFILRILQSRQD
ncbi:bax inhibitor 1 [[Candida] railenensis]|uniref:Bax inhibitor 1 n=1 Tax=[Candida] railenensis TaxID=45579 RepID=A0A9P0QUJ8_9ASCO|nr:bax inhibitor 1 [[Candida] railenensis]